MLCCFVSTVFPRPSSGDEPSKIYELLAAEPDWWWDFIWGTQKNTGELSTGESRQSYTDKYPINYRSEVGASCSFLLVKPTLQLFCINFFLCLSSFVFIVFRIALPITYCIEEVHKCKFVTFVSLSTQAFTQKGRERRGDQTDKQLQGEQRAGHHKMHPDWCEDVCLGVALSSHWGTKVTCQSGHLISSKPPQRHQSDA